LTSATVTFSSAVMCETRLNCWNTMQHSERMRAISRRGRRARRPRPCSAAHELSVDANLAPLVGLEEVDAAQQRALARAAGAEHPANRPLGHRQGDAVDDAA